MLPSTAVLRWKLYMRLLRGVLVSIDPRAYLRFRHEPQVTHIFTTVTYTWNNEFSNSPFSRVPRTSFLQLYHLFRMISKIPIAARQRHSFLARSRRVYGNTMK